MKPPFEFRVMRIRECSVPDRLIDTPESSYLYWTNYVPQACWFDPAKEAFVVLVLNTRRRIIGHNLVSLGSLDTITVHAREVFRPIIVAAGSAGILMHCLCAEAHNECYVTRGVMCSHASAALALTRVSLLDLPEQWCQRQLTPHKSAHHIHNHPSLERTRQLQILSGRDYGF